MSEPRKTIDHSLKIDFESAKVHYDACRSMFPQKALPQAFSYDPTASVSANLDNLALFALQPNTTIVVFHVYRSLFLDLVSRWIESPDKFQSAYTQTHRLQSPQTSCSIILLALSRIFPLFAESSDLIEQFLDANTQLYAFENASFADSPEELSALLLAFYRIYVFKPQKFARFLNPLVLHKVLTNAKSTAITKFLAIQLLSKYLSASETARNDMLTLHVGDSSLFGKYDADYDINYLFLELVEAKRLSNYSLLPPSESRGSSSSAVVVHCDDLSAFVTSICGVIMSKPYPHRIPVSGKEEVVATKSSIEVLSRLANSIQNNRPVLLYGQAGSGKTFFINSIAKYLCADDETVKIHLGDQTDAKLLLGAYTSGEKPGSFEWRAGVLTTAVKEGKWVLVEDIDKAPTEVLSILLTLLEKRELSIPSRGEVITAHSGFKLIATVRTSRDSHSSNVPDMIGLRLWELVEVESPDDLELKSILTARFPLLQRMTGRFVSMYNRVCEIYSTTAFISLNKGSHPRVISIRDLMKCCSRSEATFRHKGITSADQLLPSDVYDCIFAEAIDCFGSAITEYNALIPIVDAIGEILEMPSSRIQFYLEGHIPAFYADDSKIEVGRAVLTRSVSNRILNSRRNVEKHTNFATTKHSKRLMEQIGVGIQMVEPILLVGETGTGKTTVVQEIAKLMNQKLTVINVSQQTESGDLLGGYKPVNTKTVATPLQEIFENLFLATFSQKKNAKFSSLLTKCFNRDQWKNVIKLWREAIKMARGILNTTSDSDEDNDGGPKKKRRLGSKEKHNLLCKWEEFEQDVKSFESQASSLENSFVFSFVEGSLVKAVKNGEWVLLDEINLATSDTLESIADLLSESSKQRSLLLSERGDVEAIQAHSNFRIFGCMNPSTDVGKKDLPLSIRSRFSEIYVHSPDRDRDDLISIIEKYVGRYSVGDDWVIEDIAELYYEAKALAESNMIVDGANQKPHFSIRTLTRTLVYVRDIVSIYGLRRALYEGFCMAFLTLLDQKSEGILKPLIAKHTVEKLNNAKHIVSRCPPPPTSDESEYVQFRHYWLKRGPGLISTPNYILTPFVEKNLLNLVRATASRKFPVLVQGPTSAGKTSMIKYLACITGHKFVRINNHEHTDLQEYLGTYVSDSSGKLVFREGVLVEALRKGYWIVLDELNLAPTDVLEALNRLLDDNRELLIPETQEVVRPHPDFMLFATQNPPGLYGGRKVLSRAFRNRFLELHFDDIPQDELEIILRDRCSIAPSYAKKIVEVYKQLSMRRQTTRLFEQKNSFATLRDLFRWAMREAVGYEELAANGYMLLAERVRSSEEKSVVQEVIEKVMRVKLNMDSFYERLENKTLMSLDSPIVWTKSMRRLAVLVETAIKYKEPLLLVGETGCGKTSVCQILAQLLNCELITVNAHQNTETGDILGAQRPLRNRFEARADLVQSLLSFFTQVGVEVSLENSKVEDLVEKYKQIKQSSSAESITNHDSLLFSIDEKIRATSILFEWVDGPLVQAMKSGSFFLLDEISLADDSVLERLNSVLEPERNLLLAEKGTDDTFLTSADSFQFFATMNPGGDYGKKELSPALRNRFTEVWVPSMESFEDVEQIVRAKLSPELKFLSTPLVNFSEWFGKKLGNGNVNNGVISLRDILAWVEFMNSCVTKIIPELSFFHGALMVFIDSLGTNNSAYLAENEEKLKEYKQDCVNKLLSFLGKSLDNSILTRSSELDISSDKLTVGLFSIARKDNKSLEDDFNLKTPTTSANAMRMLRAMQVHKPILLEGSPGVGKTSLVSAVAKTTGNPLVRINLSEQTDLIDLFGSDAPVEGGNSGEFAWRDAPFLRAMKNGEWVLLDEMNLASQSVLEGLNACLDHRGEAYVPELDMSFPQHPDFKVFAAQNPQYQGGGRKGLPKSFVNRFSVVYMDSLKAEDLLLISERLFPEVSTDTCSKLISFMTQLDKEVVVEKKWGSAGGPWEFNLRDTLRWLSLYNSKSNLSGESDRNIGDFLNMIICQRFRTVDDRQRVRELFESHFGSVFKRDQYFSLGEDYVQAGGSLIKRNKTLQYTNSSDRIRFFSLQTNFPILESAIRSVNESIPLILTGPANAGKTELVRFLATLVGVRLSEFSMNSDVDSMDILGGYEQVDLTRSINELSSELYCVLNELLILNLKAAEANSFLISACLEILNFLRTVSADSSNLAHLIQKLEKFIMHYSNDNLLRILSTAKELLLKLEENFTVKFNWFDGLLVKAVVKGEWLILDNANLCNPSVLDRLNSLLETNGSLIINECSQSDGSPRILTPHPNFRLFMTVDPKYGELSRAMRNRCVELFMEDLNLRATTFDRYCLDLSSTNMVSKDNGTTTINHMMENLSVSQKQIHKPLVCFIPPSVSQIRTFALLHDSMNFQRNTLASAITSIFVTRNVKLIEYWKSSYDNSEFTVKEIESLNLVSQIIDLLHKAGFVDYMRQLYSSVNQHTTICYSSNQMLHPSINRYIDGHFNIGDGCLSNVSFTMLFQIASAVVQSNSYIVKIEDKALNHRVSELNFLEKSAAITLGRNIKNVSRIKLYSYVKAVAVFIFNVFVSSLRSKYLAGGDSNVLNDLSDLQCIWNSLVAASSIQNVSRLRVYHEKIEAWLKEHESDENVKKHMDEVRAIKLGLDLRSGFSMSRIWEHFRPNYPHSEKAWSHFTSYLSLLQEFDEAARRLYPEFYSQISELRLQMLDFHDKIIENSVNETTSALMLSNFSSALRNFSELAESFAVERSNVFLEQFTILSDILELCSYFKFINFDKKLTVANYSSRSTLSLMRGAKNVIFVPYPRVFESIWDCHIATQSILTSKFFLDSYTKSLSIRTCPGINLDQNLQNLFTYGQQLIELSDHVLSDQNLIFGKILTRWICEILRAHAIPEELLLSFEASSQNLADIKNINIALRENCSVEVVSIWEKYFVGTILLLQGSYDISGLGKAWVMFACGCIQLYVPTSALDPAIEDHVNSLILTELQELSSGLIDSWHNVRTVISGDDPLQLEAQIPHPTEPIHSKSLVYRSEESIDELYDEWNAFFESSLNVSSIERLLQAANDFNKDTNSQEIGVFHKNSSNFIMRLNNKYVQYADLNDILNGYIYAVRLGLDLLKIGNRNQNARFQLDSLWPTEIKSLTNVDTIESNFVVVREVNKKLGAESVLSEKLMLYFIELCFAQGDSPSDDFRVGNMVDQAFQSLYYRWYFRKLQKEESEKQEGSLYKHRDIDHAEEEFKRMFPDYDDVLEFDSNIDSNSQTFDEIYYDLAQVYVNFYVHKNTVSLRSLVEKGSSICSELESRLPEFTYSSNDSSSLAALLIVMRDSHEGFSRKLSLDTNFYHDACPAEYERAIKIVLSLYKACLRLLSQWPEHATLQNIQRGAQEFLNYPSCLPLSKLLHKVESIHNFLNEWEKFASSQVTLKSHYSQITELIVSWRRLELSSWKALFKFEDMESQKQIGKWWFHLFEIIVVPYLKTDEELQESVEKPSVAQILSALNVFISNATYGEFGIRLDLIEAFRNHISKLSGVDEDLINGLGNFIVFFRQFSPQIEDIVNETRKSLEKDVSEVILLASWKDVNIDALKQSSRRSHNSLYKLVRKYRALQNTSVSLIIQTGISSETAVASAELFNPELMVMAQKSAATKLQEIKLCELVSSWDERPTRFKSLDIVENNLKVYVDKIASYETPSIYSYAKCVVEKMEELRKETPSILSDDTRKVVAALKSQKHKLLSDTLKELRRIGIKTTSKPETKKVLATVNLIFINGQTFAGSAIKGLDSHYFRCLEIFPRLRSSILSGNEEVPQADLERGLAAAENLMFSLVTIRAPISEFHCHLQNFLSLYNEFAFVAGNESSNLLSGSLVAQFKFNLKEIQLFCYNFNQVLDYALEVGNTVSYFNDTADLSLITQAKTTINDILDSISRANQRCFTTDDSEIIEVFKSFILSLLDEFCEWSKNYPSFSFIADIILKFVKENSSLSTKTESKLQEMSSVEELEKLMRKLSTSILISVQKILELRKDNIEEETDAWLQLSQQNLMRCLKQLRIHTVTELLVKAQQIITSIEHNGRTSSITTALVSFSLPLLAQYQRLAVIIFTAAETNYVELSKSTFILLKSLSNLANNGFCSPQPPNEQKQDDNLHDGTGLGDGEGATNNSNDVDEDDDLTEKSQNHEQDGNEEDIDEQEDNSVEVENDFDGELEEVSDQDQEDKDDDNDDDDESMDEEVDDIDDLDPNAVDEKMWNEEANENDNEKDTDKMPENSINDDDNIEANEDNEMSQDETKDEQNNPDKDDKDDDGDDENDVAEQEDEVRNDENEVLDEHVPETEALELPDDLNLDEDDNDDKDESNDEMDIEDDANELPDDKNEDKVDESKENLPEENTVPDVEEEAGDEMHDHEDGISDDNEENEDGSELESNDEAIQPPNIEDNEDDSADAQESENNENGEDPIEGEGAENANNDASADMELDSATRTEAGEQAEGAENQAVDEQQNFGASGGTSSELKQENDNLEENMEDNARDELKESLKELGDTLKEFHRRHQEIKEATIDDQDETEMKADSKPDEFQHVDGENTKHDTQALGAADNKDQLEKIDEDMAIDEEESGKNNTSVNEDLSKIKSEDNMDVEDAGEEFADSANERDDFEGKISGGIVGGRQQNTDSEREHASCESQFDEDKLEILLRAGDDDFNIGANDEPALTLELARNLWRKSELATQELSAGLSESLRLILEPTLATKLRGDYKTGKRLNMKRVISYIASDFRKDKIWLRRTKPSKRQYQIMIAVDDSKSMSEGNASQLAFHSIALVSKALTQLESGGLSIVRFGEDVKLVHPFDKPFNQESGANVFQWFDFQQERTDIKQLCTKSLKIFENARSSSSSDLWQLQVIISDGVCEDHETLQRLVRRAREEKVMLVFVVIDGISSKESILDMSQVTYVPDLATGSTKLKVENYLDTFPFEFYVVVRNINELPEMLALILRQYFSEISNQ